MTCSGPAPALEVPGLAEAVSAYVSGATDCLNPALRNEYALRVRRDLTSSGMARVQVFDDKDRRVLDLSRLEGVVFWLSTAHGWALPQDSSNSLITTVADDGGDYRQPTVRGHKTSARLPFHSDRCDLSALLYVATAESGGELAVVSTDDLCQALEPSTLSTLMSPMPFDLRSDRIRTEIDWHTRPVFWPTPGGYRGHYIRRFILDSQRHPSCPRLTTAQLEAIEAVEAELDRLAAPLWVTPVRGEMVLLDNYMVLHSRKEYTDKGTSSRLALRIWMAPYTSPPLPDFMAAETGAVAGSTYRGGATSDSRHMAALGTKPSADWNITSRETNVVD